MLYILERYVKVGTRFGSCKQVDAEGAGSLNPPHRRYLAHGTATDWMYEELHVPMAFTWEIFGDMNAGMPLKKLILGQPLDLT